MKYLVSSLLAFAFICDLSAEPLCNQASPLLTGVEANCDGILMPKPWVEECVVLKEIAVPKCQGDLGLCRAELAAVKTVFEERRVACAETIRELESIAREAAGLKASLLDSFVPWLTLGFAGGFTLAYLAF